MAKKIIWKIIAKRALCKYLDRRVKELTDLLEAESESDSFKKRNISMSDIIRDVAQHGDINDKHHYH